MNRTAARIALPMIVSSKPAMKALPISKSARSGSSSGKSSFATSRTTW